MTAAWSQTPLAPDNGLLGLQMDAEAFFALGETEARYELIHGVVVMSPSPRPRHWQVILELVRQLDRFVQAGGVAAFYSDTDLQIGSFSVFCPDVCAYAATLAEPIPDRLTTPPDLVVEVLSPGSQAMDLITKRDGYEARGIKEYWVIDPSDGRVRAWKSEKGRFIESLVEGDTLASIGLPGFALDLRPLHGLAQR